MALFKNDNQQLWYVSYPPPRPDDSDEPRSPPSDKNYTVTQLSEVKPDFRACLLPVLEKVQDGLSALFSGKSKPVIYNKSFWMRYFQTLVFELSAGLVVTDHDRSETEIRQQLITPVLSWAAHYAHLTPLSPSEQVDQEYFSRLDFELITESRQGVKGRKPHVDYVLSGHLGDTTLYQVAAEAKVKLCCRDMAQLSQYMASLAASGDLNKKCTVGLLMDKESVCFLFNMLSLDNMLPLPLTLVSPAVKMAHRHCCASRTLCGNVSHSAISIRTHYGR